MVIGNYKNIEISSMFHGVVNFLIPITTVFSRSLLVNVRLFQVWQPRSLLSKHLYRVETNTKD